MDRSLRAAAALLLWAVVCVPAPALGQAQAVPSIRRVQVLPSRGQVEIEIESSDRLVPRINVLTGPDRLVVDFVNALPTAQLRNQTVNRGVVKSLRVGLFSANPPVTRIVVDLNGPQPYQVFPSGRTVIVKVGGGAGAEAADYRPAPHLALTNSSYATQPSLITTTARIAPKPPLQVSFANGMLSISSNRASLAEVLFAIHQRTGAEIAIPAGAEQEQVVAEIGPAPAPEALSQLLNGSKFNFLILSSASDPRDLDRVILSSRPEGPMPPPPPRSRVEEEEEAEAPPPRAVSPAPSSSPAPAAPAADKANSTTDQPATPDKPKPADDSNTPD